MPKKISQKEYYEYKGLADKVLSQKTRALKRWYDKYIEYYTGEREILYRQYMTEIHDSYNKTIDALQQMLLGIED